MPRVDAGLSAAKLALPRIPETYVPRPHVDKLLDAGNLLPLTVVSAGPGWGKTMVVAQWAARLGEEQGPVAWVSLDDGDNELRRFWSYVMSALRGTGTLPTWSPLIELAPGIGDQDTFLERLLSGLADLPDPVTVVLDDFQVIHDPAVLEAVGELLRRRLETLRLVLLTRADPALPLNRLRVTGNLAEIRPRDLSFSAHEAATLLESHGVPVGSEESAQLVERTEGWAAGLRLAALFLNRHEGNHAVAEFTGSDQAVSGYFADEVLGSQPPEMREFLLHTSVAERLNAELADVLTGRRDGQHQLEGLAGSNAFVVELGPGRQWFRYHALLREVLLHRLRRDAPQTLNDLHRRAATWYAEHGYPVEAMSHAADADDWHLFGRLFVQVGCPALVNDNRAALARVLRQVPNDRLGETPELALCGAGRAFLEARDDELAAHVQHARRLLESSPATSPGTDDSTQVVLRIVSLTDARARGDLATVETYASETVEILATSGRVLPLVDAYRALAHGNLGVAMLWGGRVAAAQEHLEIARLAAERSGAVVARVNAIAHLGLAAVLNGELETGFALASEVAGLVEARGWAPLPQASMAYLAAATVLLQRDDVDGARVMLAAGRTNSAREAAARNALALAQVRLDASSGRIQVAQQNLASLLPELEARPLPPFLARWLRVTRAELDLAVGDPDSAAARIVPTEDREPPYAAELVCLARAQLEGGHPDLVDATLAPVLAGDGQGLLTEAWLLTALAADRLRRDNRSIEALGCALAVAQRDAVRRPFVAWGGPGLPAMLARLAELDTGHTAAAQDLIAYLRGAEAGGGHALADPLTDRELVVLRNLATMKTNAEIADDLYVSINTVKVHLKHINRKLGVDSRRGAVRKARELGLLSAPDEPAAGP